MRLVMVPILGLAKIVYLFQDLTANDRCVHAHFQNKFGRDLFDDKDMQ